MAKSQLDLNTTVFVVGSLMAFLIVALWLYIKTNMKPLRFLNRLLKCCSNSGTEQNQVDEVVRLPPEDVRKAPPPTLPDAIRKLSGNEARQPRIVLHSSFTNPSHLKTWKATEIKIPIEPSKGCQVKFKLEPSGGKFSVVTPSAPRLSKLDLEKN